jgi:cyanophycin synthetase
MKIIKVQALRGPNIWVSKEKINPNAIGFGGNFNNKIDGFKERIEAMLPLIEHRCSEGCRGDFFQSGTRYLMGHVIEHIPEIQTLAGMDTGFGRTRETKTLGTYNVVSVIPKKRSFRRRISRCIAESLIAGTEYDLESDLQKMREIRERVRLGPSTGSIVEEAVSRNIP